MAEEEHLSKETDQTVRKFLGPFVTRCGNKSKGLVKTPIETIYVPLECNFTEETSKKLKLIDNKYCDNCDIFSHVYHNLYNSQSEFFVEFYYHEHVKEIPTI